MKKKKLLIISEFFSRTAIGDARGGVEVRCLEIAKRLAKTNDVTVLTSHEQGLNKEDCFFGIKIIRCGLKRKYSQEGQIIQRAIFMISAFIKSIKIKPDLIDTYSIVSYMPGYFASKILKIPSIIQVNDVWIGRWVKLFGFLGIIGEVYERIYLKLGWSKFVAISKYTQSNLFKVGIQPTMVKVIPCGVDLDLLKSIATEKQKEITITCISRLVTYKRVDDLIRAMKEVHQEYPNVLCRIVGSGPEMDSLKKLVVSLDLKDCIQFDGFVKHYVDVMSILKSSHIFCLPSSVEGFGIVNLEAMACGVPVVASNIKPIVEVTENGKGALLYSMGDINALSSGLKKMLSDKDIYNRMVTNGYEVVLKYNWDLITDEINKLYDLEIANKTLL